MSSERKSYPTACEVYASPTGSLPHSARLAFGCGPRFTGRDWLPAGRPARPAVSPPNASSPARAQRAFAVVAGVHVDDRIRDRIDTGEVSWYQ